MHLIFSSVLLIVSIAAESATAVLPEFNSRMGFLDNGLDVKRVMVSSRSQANGVQEGQRDVEGLSIVFTEEVGDVVA